MFIKFFMLQNEAKEKKIKIGFIEILQFQTPFRWVLLCEILSRNKSRRYQTLKTTLWAKQNSKESINSKMGLSSDFLLF